MKFHYSGKFNNLSELPTREHPEGCVPYREPESMKKLAVIANTIAVIALVVAWALAFLVTGVFPYSLLGILLSLATMVPHEFLHAIWFREDVYMYQNLKQGMLFIIGLEDLSKARFVWMSLCPNVVFGLVPYIIFLINPSCTVLGTLGIFAISMGAGDYINVYNTLTQVPRGGKTYMSGMNSFWYLPERSGK